MSGRRVELSPFDRLIGLELSLCTAERVTAWLPLRADLTQPHGLAHGGLYATIAETLASEGTNAGVAAAGRIGLGASNATSFLRPISAGAINAAAESLHRGRTSWIWDVRCHDDEGRLCAVSRVAVAVRETSPGGGGAQLRSHS